VQQNAEREKVQAQITVAQAKAKANAVRAEARPTMAGVEIRCDGANATRVENGEKSCSATM
jgi:hypothetical protein